MDEEPDLILIENLKDTYNKLDWFTVVDIKDTELVYARAKYHFSVDGNEVESEWSRVIPIDGRTSGLKLDANVILTPEVDIEFEEEFVTIKTTDFEVFSGPNVHKATTFKIKNSDNEPIFSRESDEDNLLDITIDTPFKKGKIYNIEAKHINTYNVGSNYGRKLYLNGGNEIMLFEFEAPEEFVIDRLFYYCIKIWSSLYESYTLEIRTENGQVVKKLENETKLVNSIMLDNLILYQKYNIYVKLNFNNNTSSTYKLVYSSMLNENHIIPHRPNLPYPNKYKQDDEMMTDGIACITTRELFDRKFISTDFKNNVLYLFKEYGGKLQIIKEVFTFDKTFDIDYINMFQLPNHHLVIDITTYNETRQEESAFYILSYNPITYDVQKLGYKVRVDEKYSTSICNSMVVLGDNMVWYIPAYLTDQTDTNNDREARVPLKLRSFNTETLAIETFDLPHKIIYNASLFRDMENNIYTVGGSYHNEYMQKDNGSREEYWEMEQRDIFKWNFTDKTWEKVATLPDELPKTVYTLQCHLRCDGKVVMFNAVHSGPSLGYQKIVIFDPSKKIVTLENTNLTTSVPIRNALVYTNGNIVRITSNVNDPQQQHIYYSDTFTFSDQPDIDITEGETKNLVVRDGEVKNITDIYKYDSITIQGTGILKWYRPQGTIDLDSKTLILYRDKTWSQQDFRAFEYRQVLVLDGSRLNITADKNFDDLPNRPFPDRDEKYGK